MNLTPKQIVEALDNYIIGQNEAKKAVAVALRNRYRRSQLSPELMEDITPKNIIMKGPTGVGKTEIARRLAKLVKAPFVKVEATKFTEVGYVGRDCESMIRDLVEVSVRMVKEEKRKEVLVKAQQIAYDKIFKEIYLLKKQENVENIDQEKERIMTALKNGEYDSDIIEIDVLDAPKNVEMVAGIGDINIGSIFEGILPQKKKRRKISIKEAKQLIISEESDKLIDNDGVNSEAIKRAENEGIIFIDEIDKIATKGKSSSQDVSREGVQRDILPFVEGTQVQTKYGMIKTDYILFIAAGAFHVAKMEDLIPELQGRFPIVVELANLTSDDFFRILKEPQNAIIKQYQNLLKVDNIDLEFNDEALREISVVAEQENETSENIGARRLHTIMERILQELSFNASGDYPETKVTIDKPYIEKVLNVENKKHDLKKYIL